MLFVTLTAWVSYLDDKAMPTLEPLELTALSVLGLYLWVKVVRAHLVGWYRSTLVWYVKAVVRDVHGLSPEQPVPDDMCIGVAIYEIIEHLKNLELDTSELHMGLTVGQVIAMITELEQE